MAKRRETGKGRRMKPIVLVVCEGETEEVYIDFLRSHYRCPIKIVPKILGSDISNKKIEAIEDNMKVSGSDIIHTFLMYDRDVSVVNKKVDDLDGIKLCSNPCIEFWFLLHVSNTKSKTTTKQCIVKLKQQGRTWNNYEKGSLTIKQRECLWDNRVSASEKAKALPHSMNPSSTVYKLIDFLEKSRT